MKELEIKAWDYDKRVWGIRVFYYARCKDCYEYYYPSELVKENVINKYSVYITAFLNKEPGILPDCDSHTVYDNKKQLEEYLLKDGWKILNDGEVLCKKCANNEPILR